MPRSCGAADHAAVAQVLHRAPVARQADGGVAGHAADRLLALGVAAAQQQVGDAFLGQDVRDVVAVDHDRRQRHAGLLRERPRVEPLDEGRLHVLAEGLDHLHHQLLPARRAGGAAAPGARLAAGLQPGRAGVAPAARVGAHVGRAAEAGDAARASRSSCCRARSICSVEPMNRSQA